MRIQSWGDLSWAAEAEQAKHPAFVVVPASTETVADDDLKRSGRIDVAVRLIQSPPSEYSAANCLYTTGQSTGGTTAFYLDIACADRFAASLFVGSQWGNSLPDTQREVGCAERRVEALPA